MPGIEVVARGPSSLQLSMPRNCNRTFVSCCSMHAVICFYDALGRRLSSPVGNATRSSALPWARSALYARRSQDTMMTQTLYACHDTQSITHTPQCSPNMLVCERRAL